jgi:hypothetical protein
MIRFIITPGALQVTNIYPAILIMFLFLIFICPILLLCLSSRCIEFRVRVTKADIRKTGAQRARSGERYLSRNARLKILDDWVCLSEEIEQARKDKLRH